MGSASPATGSLWFDQATGLIGEMHTDITPMYREMYANVPEPAAGEDEDESGMPKLDVEKAEFRWTIKDVGTDGPVSDADVAFTPPSSAKKVDEFDYNMSGREVAQLELIGNPAPDFSCEQFKDGTFALASQRGRIVVMDFWATWCGPCVAAIPSIQTLHEKFKDKPVTVVGINQDSGDAKKVNAFLEKKKITFAQVNDKDGTVGSLYKVTGIPCCVIIDQQGVVQDVHVGGTPDLGDEIAGKVEKLLKGEKLHTDQELAERKKEASEGRMAFEVDTDEGDDAPAADAKAFAPVNPQRLVAGERSTGQYMGMGIREADVDGDGGREHILPGMGGSVVVVGSDGAAVKTVKFQGIGARAMIQDAQPVRVGSEQRWLVVSSNFTGRTSAPAVGIFSADGKSLWTHTIDTPKGANGTVVAAVGNLAGDSTPEVALLSTNYTQAGQNRSSLIVLDADGKVLAQDRLKGQFFATMWIAPGSPTGTIMLAGDAVRRYTLDLSK